TARPGAYLSYSTWADEKALVRWRTFGKHHAGQARGRAGIFQDYRLRIGALLAQAHEGDSEPHMVGPIRPEETEQPVKAVIVREFMEGKRPRDGDGAATPVSREFFRSLVVD